MVIEVLPWEFSVCKVEAVVSNLLNRPFVFTATTDMECSLVCRTQDVPPETVAREDGWRAMRIEGPLPFSMVGILAKISGELAREDISLFAVSTFDTDYILVRAENLNRAAVCLETLPEITVRRGKSESAS
ncbi:ACT domain-containing protein [Feifania hominis]|uniref:ACT domain-containing protein n=1 Tax=Feifania hominis TaxID=2763660 RepID=A0A926DG50_9FIRM|nr:ACT domain-containing protein [Feifania hominis]MBC8536430.1 ACT domain-containing protein [Feifania hominis]